MSKPSSPQTPDYVGAAQATGQSNIQAAIVNSLLNRVNQTTPFGSQTFTQNGSYQFNPSTGSIGFVPPGGSPSTTPAPRPSPAPAAPTGTPMTFDQWMGGPGAYGDPSSSQADYNKYVSGFAGQNALSSPTSSSLTRQPLGFDLSVGNLLDPAGNQLSGGGVDKIFGTGDSSSGGSSSSSGSPLGPISIPSFSETTTLSPELQNLLNVQTGTQTTQAQKASDIAGGIDTSPIDFSSMPALPGGGDLNALRNQVSDAIYQRNAQYLDPQFAASQRQLEDKLANQGFQTGDAAVSNASGTGAMDLFNATKQKAYADARDSAIANAESQAATQFGMGLNQRQQAVSEALAGRTLPLQQLAALTGGGGNVSMPNFPSASPTQTVPGTDYLTAAVQGNNAALQNFGIQSGTYNSQIGGLAGLAGMLGMMAMLA